MFLTDIMMAPLLAVTDLKTLFTTPFTNPVVVFGLLMTVLLIVPFVAKKIRLPELVVMLAAGMVLGPHALNLLGTTGGDPHPTITLLGKVGIIYIMFQAGLEIDLNGFMKYRGRAFGFGLLTFALPMGIGLVLVWYLLRDILPQEHLVLGVILLASSFASHTLLSYPIVTSLGIGQNPAVTTALGGTIVTDTLALLALAIISAMVHSGTDLGFAFWVPLFGKMIAFMLFTLFIVSRVSRWALREVVTEGAPQYTYILVVVFGSALLAMMAGMEDIIGAFFAGLAVNRLIPHRSALANRIEFVGKALFIPIFLVSVGMGVNFRDLFGTGALEVWYVAAVIVVTLVSTKWLAAFATKLIFGYTMSQGWVIFGLTVAQAAATLAVAAVAVDLGLFNQTIVNALIVLILVTCLISPYVTEKYAKVIAREEEEAVPTDDEAPQRLLIPLANPKTTEPLMTVGMLLHDAKSGEPLFALTVAGAGEGVEERVAQGEKNLAVAEQLASAADVKVSPVTRVDLNVADGIIRALVELRIRSVLIGWNGQVSPEQRVFGSILDRLLDGSDQTLFVYRHAQPALVHKRVILAIPPFATRLAGFRPALQEINTLCDQLGVKLHIVTPSDGVKAIKAQIKSLRPSPNVDWREIGTWEQVLPELTRLAGPDNDSDLVILMSARAGSIAWEPELDRLPRKLSLHFPNNSFMVVYPRHTHTQQTGGVLVSHTPPLRHLAFNGGHPISLADSDYKAALKAVTARLPIAEDGTSLNTQLEEAANSTSIRIVEGTVLIDARVPNLRLSSISVANAGEEAFDFPTVDEPVRQIWVFISGNDLTDEEHLDRLTSISRRLREANPADLRAVKSIPDVVNVLGN